MTSVVTIVVACPQCGQPNSHSQLASLSAWLIRHWSDGWHDPVPPPSVLYRCGACGAAALRAEFADLGRLEFADHVYDVDLQASGPNRVKAMQVLRRFTDADLRQAQSWLQNLPRRIATGLYLDDATRITHALQAVGAECSVHAREISPASPESWLAAPSLQEANDAEMWLMRLDAPGLDDKGETALRLALYQHWNAPFREASVQWVPGDRRDPVQQHNARRLNALLSESDDHERLLKANLARERGDYVSAASLLNADFGDIEPLAISLRILVEARQCAVSVLG